MRTIHPKTLAEMNIERVGEKYQPSNETEGNIFMLSWCAQCQRDKSMRECIDISDCDDNERCDIIAKTMVHNIDDAEYPLEWQFGKDGQPCCTAFVDAGKPIPLLRCTKTIDMFNL